MARIRSLRPSAPSCQPARAAGQGRSARARPVSAECHDGSAPAFRRVRARSLARCWLALAHGPACASAPSDDGFADPCRQMPEQESAQPAGSTSRGGQRAFATASEPRPAAAKGPAEVPEWDKASQAMFRFESPWLFLLLVPLAALLLWRRQEFVRLRFSFTAGAVAVRQTVRSRLARLPLLLRALALVALVAALARPQLGTERVRDISRGIAIAMVVDRSSSMGQRMRFGSGTVTRLEAVKRVFRDFIDPAEGALGGRPNDLVGMTTFAQYADSVCPLTLSHGTLLDLLDTVRLAKVRQEDGTAIGDAVALAAARLRTAEDAFGAADAAAPAYEIKSKVIILLTDGENNAGDRSVRDAGRLCQGWGIKVYAIGVGGESGIQTPFGRLRTPMRPGFDDRALRGIAEMTGGKYWLATDADTLRSVHEEINDLEKSEFESERFVDYQETFMPWALAALALLTLEAVLRQTLLRTIP